MVQYDQDNNARIENENKSYYLAWKNKRLEAEPKYKDLIHAIWYVPTIARDEVVQEGLNPEQVILQMKEDFDNNIKYYEAIRVLQQLQKIMESDQNPRWLVHDISEISPLIPRLDQILHKLVLLADDLHRVLQHRCGRR